MEGRSRFRGVGEETEILKELLRVISAATKPSKGGFLGRSLVESPLEEVSAVEVRLRRWFLKSLQQTCSLETVFSLLLALSFLVFGPKNSCFHCRVSGGQP